MPKRFTETQKWDDPWFADLSSRHKLLWLYLCDACDHAGVWVVNQRLATFHLGENYDWQEVLDVFSSRLTVLSGGLKWYLKKFIQFQYPRGLSSKSPAQAWILKKIADHGLPNPFDSSSQVSHPHPTPMGYPSHKETGDRKQETGDRNKDSFLQGRVQRGDLGKAVREWVNQFLDGRDNFLKNNVLLHFIKTYGPPQMEALARHVAQGTGALDPAIAKVWYEGRKSAYGGWDHYEPKEPWSAPIPDNLVLNYIDGAGEDLFQ